MRALAAAVLVVAMCGHAHAQSAPFSVRGFADAGIRTFTARDSFDAILGRHDGATFGGGVDIVERHGFFGQVRASRFTRTGQRVFVFAGNVFALGVDDTISVTPIEISGGYRFGHGRLVVPYGAAGAGWHRFEESSPSSAAGEDARETFTGYHALGGVEFHVWRWLSAAGEAQWTTVPGALGRDPHSVSRAFGESDLGGFSARVKVIVGR